MTQAYDRLGRPTVAVPISADDRIVANPSTVLLSANFAETTPVFCNPFQWRSIGEGIAPIQCTANTGFIVLNSSAVADTTDYLLVSLRTFRWLPGTSLVMRWRMKLANATIANVEIEAGLGNPTAAAAAPTDGAFFRFSLSGSSTAAARNGTENDVAYANPIVFENVHAYTVILRQDKVRFLIDDGDALDVIVTQPDTVAQPTALQALSAFFRLEQVLAPASAPQAFISDCIVELLDGPAVDWPTLMAGQGRGVESSTLTPYLQTHQWGNSAGPAAATLSNTAASYTTLGGLFSFVPVAGAETDYCLFGYQVPAGKTLVVTGVTISAFVATALGATYCALQWALGLNGSAVSLATADGSFLSQTGRGYRRVPLGDQAFLAAAAAGTQAPLIRVVPVTPFVVFPDMFVSVIMRQLGATAGGSIRGSVGFTGYFE